jgi:CRP-like cAMP-binding protein
VSQPAKARLLDLMPALGTDMPPQHRALANQALLVRTTQIECGEWHPDRTPQGPGHLGFLLVEGLMLREMVIARGRGVELLTKGDMLRPSQEDSASFARARWQVLRPTTLAELGADLAPSIARFPVLVEGLLERVMQRSRSLAAYATIESVRSLDDRLTALFWHLAERHGRRRADGVLVPLPLTHQILAELVGARRPSVTVALKRLDAAGRVVRVPEGWLLESELPAELFDPDATAPTLFPALS